ncbi:alcohol dehydrogenase catalytic domain-containing protein [Sphingomonas sp.]|uniref:alcohol dehydrogenase catalytic domain-containing protein n=1 Tax=Sphingomonas sp. TaxID=28214 RepID=UPI0025D37C5B|nr:alcohol dehydrogenase catalytic domain-containing protein [Sphingomonas sp.]
MTTPPTPSGTTRAIRRCRLDERRSVQDVDGELAAPQVPIIPGHKMIEQIDAVGAGGEGLSLGERVGVPWLGWI